jgi:hypothetical protein
MQSARQEAAEHARSAQELKAELEGRRTEIQALSVEIEALRQKPPEVAPFVALGGRIAEILRLAEAEAADMRGNAADAADQLKSTVEKWGTRVMDEAKVMASQIRDEAERDARACREEAQAYLEAERAKAVRAAAQLEMTLASRREQSEEEIETREMAAERHLATVAQRTEEVRVEGERLWAEAERRARLQLEDAERRSTDMVREAREHAEYIRVEADRQVVAAAGRRERINAQLADVRRMLSTLGGAQQNDDWESEQPALPSAVDVQVVGDPRTAVGDDDGREKLQRISGRGSIGDRR